MRMKRLGWGIVGSVLLTTFNVSASVTPLCSSQGEDIRCSNDGVYASGYAISATSFAAEEMADTSTVAASSSYETPLASSSSPSTLSRTSHYDPDDDSCE